jgi:hypothetical protein
MDKTDEKIRYVFRGDAFRNIFHIMKGKAHYVNEICGVYRILSSGIYQRLNAFAQNNINSLFFMTMYEFYNKQYPQLLGFSYDFFNKNKKVVFNAVEQNNNKLFIDDKNFNDFIDLLKQFLKNPAVNYLGKSQCLKLKNRLRLKLHKYLYDKLSKKDLV